MSSVLFSQPFTESAKFAGWGTTDDGSVWVFELLVGDDCGIYEGTVKCVRQTPGSFSEAWLLLTVDGEKDFVGYKMTHKGIWTRVSANLEEKVMPSEPYLPYMNVYSMSEMRLMGRSGPPPPGAMVSRKRCLQESSYNFTIQIGSKNFFSCRQYLMDTSDYFEAYFQSALANPHHMELKDTDPEAFQELINYINNHTLPDQADWLSVLVVACYFQVPVLVQHCQDKLLLNLKKGYEWTKEIMSMKDLSLEDLVQFWTVASTLGLDFLQEKTLNRLRPEFRSKCIDKLIRPAEADSIEAEMTLLLGPTPDLLTIYKNIEEEYLKEVEEEKDEEDGYEEKDEEDGYPLEDFEYL